MKHIKASKMRASNSTILITTLSVLEWIKHSSYRHTLADQIKRQEPTTRCLWRHTLDAKI